ncbi:MAG: polysaccharide deacetylase family protein [Lachnospiraceae bacterium]|nr:polysaccharide deacetylase family protein [Lachnospiraceae bacterium]
MTVLLLLLQIFLISKNHLESGWDMQVWSRIAGKDMEISKTETKKIALTFDDGPHQKYTPMLLDGLKERNVKATFFLMGANAEKYPEIVKRMSMEGHVIGNHSYSHIELSAVREAQACTEITKTNQILTEYTGKAPEYIRPPFGAWSHNLDCVTSMIVVLWDIDPLDWKCQNTDQIVKRVVPKAEENAIILLHDSYETSVEAALQIIDKLQKENFEFVTVDEIILE